MKAIEEVHDVDHVGITNTIALVQQRHFWRGISADVRNYVESCEKCQQNKSSKAVPPLKPIIGPGRRHRGIFDFTMLPDCVCGCGRKYLLLIVDHTTKRIWSSGFCTKRAKPIVNWLKVI